MTTTGLRVKMTFIPSEKDFAKYREAAKKIDDNDFLEWVLSDKTSPEIEESKQFKEYFIELFVTYFKPTYYKCTTTQGFKIGIFEFKFDVEYTRENFNNNVFDFKTITDGELKYDIVRELL